MVSVLPQVPGIPQCKSVMQPMGDMSTFIMDIPVLCLPWHGHPMASASLQGAAFLKTIEQYRSGVPDDEQGYMLQRGISLLSSFIFYSISVYMFAFTLAICIFIT